MPSTPSAAARAPATPAQTRSKYCTLMQPIERSYCVCATPMDPADQAAVLASALPNLHYVWLRRRDKVRQGISIDAWLARYTELARFASHLTPGAAPARTRAARPADRPSHRQTRKP